MFKKFAILGLSLLIAVTFMPKVPLMAATEGDIDGTFTSQGYNNEFTLDTEDISIYQVNSETPTGVGTLTTNLMPQGYYYLEFQLDDLDGYEDLTLDIKLFNMTGETRDTAAFTTAFDAINARDNSAAYNTQPDSLSVSWSASYVDDAFDSETFTLGTAIDDNTWALSPTYSDGTTALTSASSATGTGTDEYARTFKVYFQPSKVAPYSSDGEWVVGIKITDNLTGTPEVDYKFKDAYNMQFYGEVQVAADVDEVTEGDQAPLLDWDAVDVGLDFDDTNAVEQAIGLTYISNAIYAERVKASETWVHDAGNQFSTDATLSANPTGNNEFALKASNLGTYDGESETLINHLSFVTVGSQKARTIEAGSTPDIYIYLALSDNFQNGTYSGTVTFGITNWVELI